MALWIFLIIYSRCKKCTYVCLYRYSGWLYDGTKGIRKTKFQMHYSVLFKAMSSQDEQFSAIKIYSYWLFALTKVKPINYNQWTLHHLFYERQWCTSFSITACECVQTCVTCCLLTDWSVFFLISVMEMWISLKCACFLQLAVTALFLTTILCN